MQFDAISRFILKSRFLDLSAQRLKKVSADVAMPPSTKPLTFCYSAERSFSEVLTHRHKTIDRATIDFSVKDRFGETFAGGSGRLSVHHRRSDASKSLKMQCTR
jgi:hypothetical protein